MEVRTGIHADKAAGHVQLFRDVFVHFHALFANFLIHRRSSHGVDIDVGQPLGVGRDLLQVDRLAWATHEMPSSTAKHPIKTGKRFILHLNCKGGGD